MSKKVKSPAIKIINPVPGGSAWTSIKRANRFVDDGRAIWEKNCIRFVHAGQLQLALNKARDISLRRTPQEIGYDGVGMMRIDQIQGLPLTGPAQKLVTLGSNRMPVRPPRCIIKTEVSMK